MRRWFSTHYLFWLIALVVSPVVQMLVISHYLDNLNTAIKKIKDNFDKPKRVIFKELENKKLAAQMIELLDTDEGSIDMAIEFSQDSIKDNDISVLSQNIDKNEKICSVWI